jgi:peroxiredoxin
LQQVLPEIEKAGATLVAVSPETPDNSLSTTEKNELQFQVLSDQGNAVARKFGLVFTLPDALRPLYEKFGIDISKYNGDDSYEIPVPATYVIDQNRIIRFSFVNTDYSQRAEPADVVVALQKL